MSSAERTGRHYIDRTAVVIRLIDRGFQLLSTVAKCFVVVWLGSYAADAIGALAGQKTDASFSIAIKYVKETGATEMVLILCAALGVAYGLIQKRLRRRTIQHYSQTIKELELALDPKRSSSELAPDGRTNPLDI